MPQTMILKFPVKPETRAQFAEILVGAIPDTRAYEGCQGADVYTPEDDEGTVSVWEEWDSPAHQQA